MEFVQFLEEHNIPAALLEEIDRVSSRKKVLKNTQLLLPGEYSKRIFFFEKGLARIHYYLEEKDVTQYFLKENDAYCSVETIFYGKPSHYGLELLEDSTLKVIEYEKLADYMDRSVDLNRLMRTMTVNTMLAFSDRIDSIQFHSARERYNYMVKRHPDILLRAPLGHIASYLGITPQTLSVIRAGSCK
ncbi:MAG: Crp/Fnr family transcriptional regulator [Mangrovibacterium sp.]